MKIRFFGGIAVTMVSSGKPARRFGKLRILKQHFIINFKSSRTLRVFKDGQRYWFEGGRKLYEELHTKMRPHDHSTLAKKNCTICLCMTALIIRSLARCVKAFVGVWSVVKATPRVKVEWMVSRRSSGASFSANRVVGPASLPPTPNIANSSSRANRPGSGKKIVEKRRFHLR